MVFIWMLLPMSLILLQSSEVNMSSLFCLHPWHHSFVRQQLMWSSCESTCVDLDSSFTALVSGHSSMPTQSNYCCSYSWMIH